VPFRNLGAAAPDAPSALMIRCRADLRSRKLDLGVSVYRDTLGQTPIFAAVKRAEAELLSSRSSKTYLGSEGDQEFVALLAAEAFSMDRPIAGLQTIGGTGGLRLAGDLLARTAPGRRLWLGAPTWANHLPIFSACGLQVASCANHKLLDALQAAAPGDAVLIQACCHNPTGLDGTAAYWDALVDVVLARGLVVLVDFAYQGLGNGWREDCMALLHLLERVPNLLIAYSCDKNFGLYRERVGALFVVCPKPAEVHSLLGHLIALARVNYSMPPDHGAAVVRCILESPALKQVWRFELEAMRTRIRRLRAALAAYGRVGAVDLSQLDRGTGMFALLPIGPAAIDRLRSEFGVYLGPEGRINIAGLAEDTVHLFVDALDQVQERLAG
jgi:aromatic-amino-acid transaminase